MAKVFDLVDTRCMCGEGIDGETSVGAKSLIIRFRCTQAAKTRFGQPVAGLRACGTGFFQFVAEGHEFIDLGDDAMLFGEGWDRDSYPIHFVLREATASRAGLFIDDEGLEVG